jgi:hypothetical protein
MEKRAQVSLEALRKCYDNPFIDDECGERLYKLASGEKKDYPLVRTAAAIVSEKESPGGALRFLELVLHPGNRKKLCAEELWQKAVVGAMSSETPAVRATAGRIAAVDCWPHVKERLTAELDRAPAGQPEICDVLKKKKGLTGERAKKCVPAPTATASPQP